MTKAQIVAALATTEAAKREGTPLNILVYLATQPVEDRTRADATNDLVSLWIKMGGTPAEDA